MYLVYPLLAPVLTRSPYIVYLTTRVYLVPLACHTNKSCPLESSRAGVVEEPTKQPSRDYPSRGQVITRQHEVGEVPG